MASVNDKITDTRNSDRPNSARVSSTRSVGGTTLACNDLTGWPTASKVHGVTYQIDSNSNPVDGTQIDFYGIVSGNNITSFTVVDGTDNGNSVNDVVEMLPTAAWGQDLSDALILEHDRTGGHTTAAVTAMTSDILAAIMPTIYPVGSIYTNASVSTNPATLLGFGTWTAFGDGRVLVGNGTSDQAFAAGATGGASTHTLTIPEMPAHTHNRVRGNDNNLGGNWGWQAVDDGTGLYPTESTGGGGAHNNLQPYIVVYMWKRTA